MELFQLSFNNSILFTVYLLLTFSPPITNFATAVLLPVYKVYSVPSGDISVTVSPLGPTKDFVIDVYL